MLTIDRAYDNGPHQPEHVALLDQLRPHLTRALMMSARLGMMIAETTLGTLEAVGLAALVINRNRQVLAVKQLAQDHTVQISFGPLSHCTGEIRSFHHSPKVGMVRAQTEVTVPPVWRLACPSTGFFQSAPFPLICS